MMGHPARINIFHEQYIIKLLPFGPGSDLSPLGIGFLLSNRLVTTTTINDIRNITERYIVIGEALPRIINAKVSKEEKISKIYIGFINIAREETRVKRVLVTVYRDTWRQ
jgi:hypothetical protein